jgi:hypothetical protein
VLTTCILTMTGASIYSTYLVLTCILLFSEDLLRCKNSIVHKLSSILFLFTGPKATSANLSSRRFVGRIKHSRHVTTVPPPSSSSTFKASTEALSIITQYWQHCPPPHPSLVLLRHMRLGCLYKVSAEPETTP